MMAAANMLCIIVTCRSGCVYMYTREMGGTDLLAHLGLELAPRPA